MRGADGRTYSEHSRSPSYSRIELGLRTKYCAFWSGRTDGAMVEIYSLSRFVTAPISACPPVIPEAYISISSVPSSDASSDFIQICHRHKPFRAEVDANCFVSWFRYLASVAVLTFLNQ